LATRRYLTYSIKGNSVEKELQCHLCRCCKEGEGLKFYFSKRPVKKDVMNTSKLNCYKIFRFLPQPPQNRPPISEKYEKRTFWGYKLFA